VFNLFFVDRLVAAVVFRKSWQEIAYPSGFIAALGFAGTVATMRERRMHVVDRQSTDDLQEKKTN